jgi:hypothetical protein
VQHPGIGPKSSLEDADVNPHEGSGQRTDALAMNRIRIDYMTTVQEDDQYIDGGKDKCKVTTTASRSSMEEVNQNLQGNSYEQESNQNELSEIDRLNLDLSSEYHPLDRSSEDHLDLELAEFLSEWYLTDDTTPRTISDKQKGQTAKESTSII